MLYYPEKTYERIGYTVRFQCHSCDSRIYGTWDKALELFRVDVCDVCNTRYFDLGKAEGIERMKHRIKDLVED